MSVLSNFNLQISPAAYTWIHSESFLFKNQLLLPPPVPALICCLHLFICMQLFAVCAEVGRDRDIYFIVEKMSAHSKRPRINEVGDISAKQEEVVADAIVAPLTLLSCRVAEKALVDERKYIPHEADATITEERSELMRQLAMLDIKKNMYIEKREDELALKREETLKHMKAVGGPDSYCTDCDTFYKTLDKEDNRCSVEDCVKHVSCPKCYESAGSYHNFYDEDSGEEFEETESVESFYCWEEQCSCAGQMGGYARPSSGYVKCWICEKNLCILHFQKHYDMSEGSILLRFLLEELVELATTASFASDIGVLLGTIASSGPF